jgi:hypothetical protein
MKKNYLLCLAFAMSSVFYAQTIFINEIHYDNNGGDVNEGIEIAGPAGTDLTGYEVRFYNGSDDSTYNVLINLSGIIPNQQNNLGTLWFDKAGIQNGSPDGIALVDNLGNVVQFLSYEGTITAIDGVANGMTSVDIGVSENESTPVGYSLQLIGNGKTYSDFTWSGPVAATPGFQNANQTLPIAENTIENFTMYPNPVVNGKFSISSKNKLDKLVEINTLLGKQVYNQTVKANETVEVSFLNKGIYILKVEEEGKLAIKKLIIQ